MREIEGLERVISRLSEHWPEIQRNFDEENQRYLDLMGKSHDAIGRLLRCHLVVENYLNRYLAERHTIEIEILEDFNFRTKALMLPSQSSSVAFVKPGILRLNTIRNKYAHQLDARLQHSTLGPISDVLRVARPNRSFEDPIDAVEAFTAVACAFLIVPPRSLRDVFADAFAEISV